MDISLQNLKKPLDIYSGQIERKRFKEYLVKILADKGLPRLGTLARVLLKRRPKNEDLRLKTPWTKTKTPWTKTKTPWTKTKTPWTKMKTPWTKTKTPWTKTKTPLTKTKND